MENLEKRENSIHFIGIGGISMSAIAQIMLDNGWSVSGSDRSQSSISDKLADMGIKIYIGHSPDNIKNPNIVVYTAAIAQDNPELVCARDKGIRCLERAEFLGELINEYAFPIAVCGTHGKTTTTSMISCVYLKADKNPTILVGGELDKIGGNLAIGSKDYLIFEACEYKDSFLSFGPKAILALNLEEDHLDYFSGIEQIKDSFKRFFDKLPKDGFAVINADDKELMDAACRSECRKVYYGMENGDFTPANITYDDMGHPVFDVVYNGEILASVHLQEYGRHNISNALGAFALAYTDGLDVCKIVEGLEYFGGTGRRFEYRKEINGAKVYDDYAHHPTEVKSTLMAAKDIPHNNIWCIFQPHTYTRTKAFRDDFAKVLVLADKVILTDIYAAREPFDPSISAKDIADQINGADYMTDFGEIAQKIRQNAQKDDIIFIMGAGTVTNICDLI
ncbi:MAG: UDP-N-acetylmuramate--L-alanine ligase [Eubacteriales bacterium]|nr:UDP-N-acetylmuramate--L-alanine ligase [Eubacteriales bacterium]